MPPDQGDESIVEREIRLQLEKEAEIAKLHRSLETNATSNASDELETTGRPTKGGTYGAEEAASPDVGRRRHFSVTYDDRHAISEYSRVGESLIARELMEQKRREDELRNRHRNPVAKVKDGEDGIGRNSSGKPDSGHAVSARKSSFQKQLSFEDPEEEEPDLGRIGVECPPRRTRGDRLPPPSGERRLRVDGRRRATEAPRDRRRSSGLEAENLRRMAADRLRQELLSERQREIDLQRQGKISTTSEDRVGLDPSLLTKGKTTRGAASSTPDAAHRSVGDGLSHRIQVDAPGLSEGGGGGSVNRPSAPSRSNDRQSETMRTSMELRIEEEVREARKREKELRSDDGAG